MQSACCFITKLFKIFYKITLRLNEGVYGTYMNFVFRFRAHPQDMPLYLFQQSEENKNLKCFWLQAFQTRDIQPELTFHCCQGPSIWLTSWWLFLDIEVIISANSIWLCLYLSPRAHMSFPQRRQYSLLLSPDCISQCPATVTKYLKGGRVYFGLRLQSVVT